MKKPLVVFAAVAFINFFNSCAGSKLQTANAAAEDNSRLLTLGPLWGTVYQQKASEYKALTIQAYNIAQERLDQYIQQQTDKPFAVITDIDETILDNSPNAVHNGLNGQTYTDSSWIGWTKRADCDTVPGAPAFFKYAASKKVEVFYISNRLAAEMPQTITNLQKYNMPYADETHVMLKTTSSNKDARRAAVAEKYNVLLFFGDNLGDYKGIYDKQPLSTRDSLVKAEAADFGRRFIVLPNPVYGEWQNSIIHYNYKLSNGAKADTMIHTLRSY